MVEGIGFITGHDFCVEAVNRHIHNAEFCVIIHFFLTEERHGSIGVGSVLLDKIRGRNKHTAGTAGRVKHCTMGRFDNIDNHTYQRFRREENTVIRCHSRSKFVEEVLVDTSDNVVLHFVERAVIENSKKLTKKIVLEDSVILRQNTLELRGLGFD